MVWYGMIGGNSNKKHISHIELCYWFSDNFLSSFQAPLSFIHFKHPLHLSTTSPSHLPIYHRFISIFPHLINHPLPFSPTNHQLTTKESKKSLNTKENIKETKKIRFAHLGGKTETKRK